MIPKIIHMSWTSKDVVNSDHPLIRNGLHNLISLNPDWDLQISTDEEVDLYLQKALGSDYSLVKNIGVVPKTDLWRLFKMYNEGGLYIDIDRLCNIPLRDVLDENVRCVLPTCGNNDFSHDLMLSAPQNPIFAAAIKAHLTLRREGHTNVYLLGPQTFMHAVTHTFLGRIVDTNPGADVFDEIRTKIKEFSFIKTYTETPPGDTLVNKSNISADEWEAMKRDFYAKNGVKHWTGEW